MEHSSPTALLHLKPQAFRMYIFQQCIYYDQYNKPASLLQAGPLPFFQYFLVTRGLLLIKRHPICPLNQLSCHNKAWELHTQGAKESFVATTQLKHRHPLSTTHKVTWGLFVQSNKEFERTLVIGYQATAWKPGVFT